MPMKTEEAIFWKITHPIQKSNTTSILHDVNYETKWLAKRDQADSTCIPNAARKLQPSARGASDRKKRLSTNTTF
jgi:hypothetical protein